MKPPAFAPPATKAKKYARCVSARSLRPRLLQPATGLKQGVTFVRNDDIKIGAAFEMRLQLIGEIVDIDDEAPRAAFRQTIEHMVDQRFTTDLDQRFRPVVGQGTHPGAETCGQDESGGGCGHAEISLLPKPFFRNQS